MKSGCGPARPLYNGRVVPRGTWAVARGNMEIRKHVYYSGMVQGVGFRYTARSLARDRCVSGFVRNLRDGRVEVVAEGETSEVERLLDDIGEAMRGYIHRTEVSDESPTAEFGGFGVSFED